MKYLTFLTKKIYLESDTSGGAISIRSDLEIVSKVKGYSILLKILSGTALPDTLLCFFDKLVSSKLITAPVTLLVTPSLLYLTRGTPLLIQELQCNSLFSPMLLTAQTVPYRVLFGLKGKQEIFS